MSSRYLLSLFTYNNKYIIFMTFYSYWRPTNFTQIKIVKKHKEVDGYESICMPSSRTDLVPPHQTVPRLCRAYLTPKKTGKGMQNIRFPSMVMLNCLTASAQSRLKKAVSHLDMSMVNLALSDLATTLSTYCCLDVTITSLLRALWTIFCWSAFALT